MQISLRGVTPALPNRGNNVIIKLQSDSFICQESRRDLEQISKSDKIIDKDEKLNTEKVLLLLNSVDYYSPISVNLNYKINF